MLRHESASVSSILREKMCSSIFSPLQCTVSRASLFPLLFPVERIAGLVFVSVAAGKRDPSLFACLPY